MQSVEHTEVAFRPARARDLPTIVRLLAEDPLGAQREKLADPLPSGYLSAFEDIIADANQQLVVATLADEIVGVMQLSFIPYLTYQGSWRAQIEGVRVAEAHRSRGVGRAIFEWAIARARDRGCHLVQLTTDARRPDALRFYESLGFAASHHGMKLHLDAGEST